MFTTTLSDEEKIQLLTHLGKIYRKGNLCRDLTMHGCIMESESSYADIELASQIQIILLHMDKEKAEIIQNDFLDIKESHWYVSLYTAKEYAQLKSSAMTQFLDCLYV